MSIAATVHPAGKTAWQIGQAHLSSDCEVTESIQHDKNVEEHAHQQVQKIVKDTDMTKDADMTTESSQRDKNVEEHDHQQVQKIVKDADMTSLKKNEK